MREKKNQLRLDNLHVIFISNINLIYFICIIRLAVLPVIVFFFVRIFTDNPMMIYVPVVIAAMPVAVNAPLIAQEYNGNALLASSLMFISTIFSLVTLPVVLMILKSVM